MSWKLLPQLSAAIYKSYTEQKDFSSLIPSLSGLAVLHWT